MPRLEIHHRTVYRYTAPVKFGLHRLVLRPREGHRTTVRNHRLTLTPSAHLTWMTDIFGNHIALAAIDGEAEELIVDNSIDLDILDEIPDPGAVKNGPLSAVTLPSTWLQYEAGVAAAYAVSSYPDETDIVREWTLSQIKAGDRPARDVMKELNGLIHRTIRYRRREESGVQTPASTLTLGTGSCRDMATLALEAARTLGLAARFVSGYVESSISAAGLGSTHAWVEVYLPDCGWRAFDPTSGKAADVRHIPLGVSSHPRGVMPISGSFDNRTGRFLGMTVTLSILPRESKDPAFSSIS
ncbi:MAG: hypothetical protein JWL81_101 [Verrucomicrobiales bacterium]|nr:hypothetical protein [Verrucomicrobiales bacterium]